MKNPHAPRSRARPVVTAPDHLPASPESAVPREKAPAKAGNGLTELTNEDLRRMIAEAAYCRAQQRGFAPGHELEDWLGAEKEGLGKPGSARQR